LGHLANTKGSAPRPVASATTNTVTTFNVRNVITPEDVATA
jgi:hypothetical protein